jgi:hypothetical protein
LVSLLIASGSGVGLATCAPAAEARQGFVAGGGVVGQDRARRFIWGVIIVGVVAGWVGRAAAQDLMRVVRNVPGESKPLDVAADEVTTWIEDGRLVVLAKGNVLVQMGTLHSRFTSGVLWIDLQGRQKTRVLHADLYAEGDVRVENGTDNKRGKKALIDLNTRGTLELKSIKSRVAQQVRGDDDVYRRALTERASVLAPTSPVQPPLARSPQVQPQSAPGTPPASPVQRTNYEQGQPPQPAPLPPPPTPPPGAASGGQVPTPGAAVAPAQTPPIQPPAGPAPGPRPGPPNAALQPPGTAPPAQALAVTPQPPGTPAPLHQFSIEPRRAGGFQFVQLPPLPTGEQVLVITGGVILNVRGLDRLDILDIAADRLVVWTRGNVQELVNNMRRPEGEISRDLEFYLAGNVEIRSRQGTQDRLLRADEVYYDVGRHVAVALTADLEFKQPGLPDPVHMQAHELHQLNTDKYEALETRIFSSRTPGDPGLTLVMARATLEQQRIIKKSIFGRTVTDRLTGQPLTEPQDIVHGDSVFLKIEDIPVLYLPFVQGDAHDPLGPIQNFNFGYNRIFGGQFSTTLNVYDLVGLAPVPGTRWRMDLDYLTSRGPALGTQFEYGGKDLLDIPNKYNGLVKAWGIHDTGKDILGGGRGELEPHPDFRGRFLWRQNVYDLPYGFTVQSQLAAFSDKNLFEQYYKLEFDTDINQETFVYVKQQQDNWAWTILAEPRLRRWVTETESLPSVDGWIIGQSFFNLFTYTAHGSAGFFQLKTTDQPPPPVSPTDVNTSTGRFDLWQEASLPFYLGPIKLAPYALLDLTDYTDDLTGVNRGRVYGGGGVRASLPLTRLYPDVQSVLLNLNGINHKLVLTTNYYIAQASEHLQRFPQLDRLDDDATDQARRDFDPRLPFFNPQHGLFLATSPLFDPQIYAIRRLVDNRIDTLDDIEVLQLDIRQRLQTKRGYPGQQHIVDWMTLDLSGSFFPHANRDNFGENFAFLEYDWLWNIGDRTALASTGWIDPISQGPRVFTLGAFFNRPDRTNFYLGYRQIDPVESRAVTGAVTYVFSPKYATTFSTTYDFGTNQNHSLSNSLVLTRMGSDLQVSLGFTYNALQNNFGVVFEIFPNLVTQTNRRLGIPAFGSGLLGH